MANDEKIVKLVVNYDRMKTKVKVKEAKIPSGTYGY